ncbi:MAG: class I SAM-dependent methyltransferase [Alphaproteobacteria bacterium]|nr:class I SAM-dependent methyltransferase [Alphaproteobacteria bacterium]
MNGSRSHHDRPLQSPDHGAPVAPENPVVKRLKQRITRDGPVSVATFMETALGDQDGGYYTTRDPLGAAGDFTTSPEISQVFGEIIGMWCADTWQKMGSPAAFALIEMGPGRGTLMADALRALRMVPDCRSAASLHLVETSPVLRDIQQKSLRGENITWHAELPDIGRTPAILIANEFLDALPIQQYIKFEGQWCERVVALDETHDRFCFGIHRSQKLPARAITQQLVEADEGTIFEYAPEVQSMVSDIAHRLFLNGGAGLIIDYGYTRHAVGQTLQAVQRHRPVDPLDTPGDCDLTAHVNFQLVAETARAAGIKVWGPVDQGVFLQKIGIVERTNTLLKSANVAQSHDIRTAVTRLIAPAEMGTLFKALAITDDRIKHLAGFGTDS